MQLGSYAELDTSAGVRRPIRQNQSRMRINIQQKPHLLPNSPLIWIEQWSASCMRLFSSRPAGLVAKSFLKHNQASFPKEGRLSQTLPEPVGV
jgi:hypothetical protein